MKKLLMILLCFTMIPAITVFAAFTTEEVEYTYTINNDHWFNLTTGVYEYNVDYNTTNRIAIKYDSINLSSFTSFHHMLFFNGNEYLGYYNSQYSDLEIGDKFLGQINTFTPTIPTSATHFVIQNYNNYRNLVPIAELNHHTLREVFETNLYFNQNFTDSISGWFSYNDGIFTLTSLGMKIVNPIKAYSGIGISNNFVDGNKYYYILGGVIGNSILQVGVYNAGLKSISLNYIEQDYTCLSEHLSYYGDFITLINEDLNKETFIKYLKIIDTNYWGISALTVAQMDSWFSVYQSNPANDIYYTSYRDLNVTNPGITYIYQKEIPDTTQPIDKLENFMDDLGLGSKAVKLTIAIVVIATTMILLVMVFKSPALIIIIASALELVLFVFMGWVPNYVIIVLAVLLFILIIKERSGNNEA